MGWLAGMVAGSWMVWTTGLKSSIYAWHVGGSTISAYAAIDALVLNLVLAVVLTPAFAALAFANGSDETSPADYDERLPVEIAV